MKNLLLIIFLLQLFINIHAQDWKTHYEQSDFKKTSSYTETLDYFNRLDAASPMAATIILGKSPQGREIPMMIIDRDGLKDPLAIRSKGRVITLIQACIHPGEPDGKDAALVLLRDMLISKKHRELLDKTSILFIPILNVDGHERFGPYNRINQNGPEEMGWRTNAHNLNLNRDFLKADAVEMQHWLRMYSNWLPDFFIDIHTTDGADFQYALTYDIEVYGNLDSGITRWLSNIYEARITAKMKENGFPIFPYVQFRNWHDPRSGLRTGAAPPMISQGYAALQNRPALLIETHMLKDYKTRVNATIQMLIHTLFIINHQADNLKTLIEMADKSTAAPAFRKQPHPVSWKTSTIDSTMVDFYGFDYQVLKSDLTGGDWFVYDNARPIVMKLPFFNKSVPETTVLLPEAYIIPAEWTEVINRMKLHGIKMDILSEPAEITVKSYKFKDYEFRKTPNEGRHMVSTGLTESEEKRIFPAGSAIVATSQRTARVIAAILEPAASGSYVEWGFFNAVFEQKEYSETYVMEKMAREMLEKSPELRREFEAKKSEPGFTGNQWTMLNWFYSKTPYWDQQFLKYPVGKITDSQELTRLRRISAPPGQQF
ncbi:zinc carboxypeptidase [Lentimicrobium saccharophilum]|uniref:Zinc carboxypeptidase n=1 Tax=Lentimicrobium saccharophilum TaxID=1678841 RepID=A0A0S7BQ35_9BACT|nr:M14 family metallopeptidase [Lentimicrobium saccharophilum]GAP42285.1 zinc carboxypeptidase [Lentimicrobium saccharophilum]